MVTINWLDRAIEVRRLVLNHESLASFSDRFQTLADSLDLPVAAETTTPEVGDLWIGCVPRGGWGQRAWREVGWVRSAEAPLALAQLLNARVQREGADRPVLVRRN